MDAVRHLQALHLDPVLRATAQQVDRHDPVDEDARRPVDIGEEAVQRFQTLLEPALDQVPVGGVEEPGQEVDRDDPLLRPVLLVDRKGDSLVQEGALGVLLHGGDRVAGHLVQRLAKLPAMGSRHAGSREHLVIERRVGLVAREETLPRAPAVAVASRLPAERFASHGATLAVCRIVGRLSFG